MKIVLLYGLDHIYKIKTHTRSMILHHKRPVSEKNLSGFLQ